MENTQNHSSPPAGNTPLLLLSGLMCDAAFWAPLVPGLPQDVTAQVVDYGDADTLTAMAETALAMAPACFVLAGHSMGGRVAMEVARLAPDRVAKLILMDTGYLPLAAGAAGDTERAGRMALLAIARAQGVRAMCSEWVKGMVHPGRLHDADLMQAIIDMFDRKTADRFALQLNALLTRPDASPVLASLTMPTLLMCGRQDAWANVAQHQAMLALAVQAKMAAIEDAGHMILMERPQETSQAITQFLI